MLVFILVATAIIVGGSVLVGMSLNKGNRPRRQRGDGRDGAAPMSRAEKMEALKASGALKHRKSNR